MTRTELQQALWQQQAENAALRAELARYQPVGDAPAWTSDAPQPNQEALGRLMQDLYTAVVITDGPGRILWVSQGFTDLCGFELAEVVGQPAGMVMRPIMKERPLLEYVKASLAAKVPFQYEVRNPRRGADVAGWIRVKTQPILDAAGTPAMWVGMVEDITEWKKTQLTLDESERRFQALAENVPGVLYQWRKNYDGSFHFGYVSPKLYELFGIRVEDIVRMPEFVHPEDLPAFLQSMQQAVETRSSWSYEGRLVVSGQPMRWMQGNSGVAGVDELGVKYSGILYDVTPVKMAGLALRESDIRLRLAVEGFGDGAWELNVQTREVYYSPDYKAMLGYQDEDFPNELNTWFDYVHPDDLKEVRATVASFLHGNAPLGAAEYRIRCKNGTYKWVMSRAVLTARDEAGAPLILTGLHTDISELKKAKEALDEASRRLSTVIANFQEGLVLEDEHRNIVLTNDAFCQMLEGDFTPTRLIGKNGAWLAKKSFEFVQNPVQYAARITALLRRRKLALGDVLKLKDGRSLRRSFTPIYDHERYIGHLWSFEDITARTHAETDLRQREEKYRGIIENMSLGLVEADLKDHLLYANQSFCDMTGFCNEELTGRRLSPLLLTGDDLKLVESKLVSRELGVADSYEIAVTTKTGERKWLLVSGAPLYNDFQELIGSIGIYLDVTPQKHLEDSLREAKGLAEISTRAKQEFLANMSHEIRTPMNAIQGMSQLLAKTPLDEVQANYLHAITASAENLLVIINDILDLSKIEAGRMALEQIGFSPSAVYAQVEKTIQYKAEEKGLSFETRIDPQVPDVLLGDPYRLTQVLLNLAGNSVKFTERGTIVVGCAVVEWLAGDEVLVEFSVQDTGVGIDAEYLTQVFDDFSQEDSSVTRKFGGTGLGLGISKKLVELLGGELLIESEKNRGTTSRFVLRLPVGAAHDVPQKDGDDVSGLQHALRGQRILLVEDNMFNRMLATIFLTNGGMTVTEASNGEVAVELARNQEFDLILMDVQMPVMNGYEATAFLRQELGLTVPIIALTANAIVGERAKCLAAGMNDYLTKPFQEASLIKMVYDWTLGENHLVGKH